MFWWDAHPHSRSNSGLWSGQCLEHFNSWNEWVDDMWDDSDLAHLPGIIKLVSVTSKSNCLSLVSSPSSCSMSALPIPRKLEDVVSYLRFSFCMHYLQAFRLNTGDPNWSTLLRTGGLLQVGGEGIELDNLSIWDRFVSNARLDNRTSTKIASICCELGSVWLAVFAGSSFGGMQSQK